VAEQSQDDNAATPVAGGEGEGGQRRSTVRLGGEELSLSELRAHPERYTRAFERAKTLVGYAECLCASPSQKLVIRLRGVRFHLACWPEQGGFHSPGCDFHRLSGALSGRSSYHGGAIVEEESVTHVRLSNPLEVRGVSTRRSELRAIVAGAGRTEASSGPRRTVGLLGLLHYLWEVAGLHGSPSRSPRRWADCRTQLAVHAEGVHIVNGRALQRVLHIVPPYRPETAAMHNASFQAFTGRLGRHGQVNIRGLLLGEIKTLEPSTHGWRFKLCHLATPVYSSDQLVLKIRNSYRAAFSEQRPASSRQVGLFLVERTPKGHVNVVDAAAMLTTSTYVPADSSYEVRMADHLAAAGRRFTKPLRYDSKEGVFPDFAITDTELIIYVEVWGIAGRLEYELRKREKCTHYERAGTLLIEWEVTEPLPIVDRIPGHGC
jgi:hypothetical protein